jgi:hypothetical protein
MERNTDLFFEIAEAVRTDPGSYRQDRWAVPAKTACGSRCCIAGKAVLLRMPQLIDEVLRLDEAKATAIQRYHNHEISSLEEARIHADLAQREARLWEEIPALAGPLLGLDSIEAEQLFAGEWAPVMGLTVPEALEKIGAGTPPSEVSYGIWDHEDGCWIDDDDSDDDDSDEDD